ncbi:unnamed protein product, partial [Mesorhabditis belari]|uniref:Large ribosomal subunit protein eL28 n=1 Tax=Mesorhabditis belari TaxID=2138241 RepID=A0AAF3FL38_9BILA
MSSDIAWQIIRNNSSFLKTRKNVPKKFSTEKFNLMSVNSQRFNGLINDKAIDIQITGDGKSLKISTKSKQVQKPASSVHTTTVRGNNPRAALRKVARIAKGYKSVAGQPAQRRASQLLRSLKTHKSTKKTGKAE